MTNQYHKFRRFFDQPQAEELQSLLRNHGIESIITGAKLNFDVNALGAQSNSEFEVQLKLQDFNNAEAILEENGKAIVEAVDKDHYLFDFDNEELFEILAQPDEWHELDYALAQRILKERGETVNPTLINILKDNRKSELNKPAKNQILLIILGYVFALWADPLLGIVIGSMMWWVKKTLPNGNRVYIFSDNNRKHGIAIFCISAVFIIINLIFFDRLMGLFTGLVINATSFLSL